MTNYLLDTNHASWLMAQQDSLVTDDKHFTFVDGITVDNWRV